MRIIQAMKQVKDLQRKADDLRDKVGKHCADLDHETPVYGTAEQQAQQVAGWIQAHTDIVQEILRLKTAINKTNSQTNVTIVLNDKPVTKSITEWVYRRRELAKMDLSLWKVLGDRNLKETIVPSSVPGGTPTKISIRRYYNPAVRDTMVNLYASEPLVIDSSLEVANAMTDIEF